eukprot:TRINITY_DN1945_c0_g1_i1.p1 TRINITY_DN1945_c0_g1~~TRINITY_DN1945_c0_g1_i1.p1  ORF type:complete len:193 (+),score=57.90 TRINITY_DN1945_c0_g1_i1:122-700(+)
MKAILVCLVLAFLVADFALAQTTTTAAPQSGQVSVTNLCHKVWYIINNSTSAVNLTYDWRPVRGKFPLYLAPGSSWTVVFEGLRPDIVLRFPDNSVLSSNTTNTACLTTTPICKNRWSVKSTASGPLTWGFSLLNDILPSNTSTIAAGATVVSSQTSATTGTQFRTFVVGSSGELRRESTIRNKAAAVCATP